MHFLFNYICPCNNYNYAFGEKIQCHCKGKHFQWGKCSAHPFWEEDRGREVEALPSRPSATLYLPKSRKLFYSWVIREHILLQGQNFQWILGKNKYLPGEIPFCDRKLRLTWVWLSARGKIFQLFGKRSSLCWKILPLAESQTHVRNSYFHISLEFPHL